MRYLIGAWYYAVPSSPCLTELGVAVPPEGRVSPEGRCATLLTCCSAEAEQTFELWLCECEYTFVTFFGRHQTVAAALNNGTPLSQQDAAPQP